MAQSTPALDRASALKILQSNCGFQHPDAWVGYAIAHGFKPVAATPIRLCPDCGGTPAQSLGQYIYYSTLIHLLECASCALIWADARIESKVVTDHFEQAYKGDEYFDQRRAAIFRQLTDLIISAAPTGGRVLDIGGAEGHLMHQVQVRRPDLTCTVHDISTRALDHARLRFGLDTLNGRLTLLLESHISFDVIVASDVLYYEPDLPGFWAVVSECIAPGGTLIMRIPNKLPLIRLANRWRRLTSNPRARELDVRVPFLNPEHILILSRRYLRHRLSSLGFTSTCLVSPILARAHSLVQLRDRIWFLAARAASWCTASQLLLTPGIVVVARRQ